METLIDFPLEEAMILYAIRWRTMAYEVAGWKVFKLEYPCERTTTELFDKFWDEIIPNMNNYNVVQHDDFRNIADRLSMIPNPRKINVPDLSETTVSNIYVTSDLNNVLLCCAVAI